MYINPIAFGILITLIVEVVIVMIAAYVSFRHYEEEVEQEDGIHERDDR